MTNENMMPHKDLEFIAYDGALELVKEKVNNALSAAPVIIRKYTKHLTASTGKYIRAVSLLICAQNREGNIHPNAVSFAAAIELLHLATLVHDDVMDDAGIRRGQVTLQKKYGKKTAVICGDYLLSIALKMAASVPNREDYIKLNLPDYVSRVCLGELNQHINNGFLDLSAFKYLKIISGKTAALFEAAFCAGAVLSNYDSQKTEGTPELEDKTLNKYMRLGRYIGMIFQIQDDCMDFEKTEEAAKKPVQSDYQQGVITLPLIYAFQKMMGLKEKARSNSLTREEINTAVSQTGGLDYTHGISGRYYDKSMKLIEQLDISSDKRSKLIYVLDKAYGKS
ncbi:polyprenyl synthetase family protein [Ruminiclostridium cellobioparum]|uniref:polyprenyl synthetase family protein n=1 Tax=Ruminiclostridium cellobioparum TaxID=29355 RepID=UPI0028B01263|nr:polyprenyl synthetase family protein [Ruminiclostridium cellobioparum]